MIEAGMRAISVKVHEVIGVAGFVLPGTRVDVLVTLSENTRRDESSTRVILQNVRTLAAGQSIQQDKEGKPQAVGVVTFLLTPEQAETLALASQQGRIQLTLRNTLDTTATRTPGTRVSALMGQAPRPAGPRRSRPSTGVPVAAPTTVEVYRGGVRSLERF
jgi:pilus assembly protein CpaB